MLPKSETLALFLLGLALGCRATPVPGAAVRGFDPGRDPLSLHYDHSPDKDDGHSAAADRTLLETLYGAAWLPAHVVAVSGAYGENAKTFDRDSDAALDYTRSHTAHLSIRDANAYLNVKGGDAAFERAALAQATFGESWRAAFAYYAPDYRLDFSDTGELLHIVGLGVIGFDEFRERCLEGRLSP